MRQMNDNFDRWKRDELSIWH